jgi:hypothetical protein
MEPRRLPRFEYSSICARCYKFCRLGRRVDGTCQLRRASTRLTRKSYSSSCLCKKQVSLARPVLPERPRDRCVQRFQTASQPVRLECDDGSEYVVKGRNAGRIDRDRSNCCPHRTRVWGEERVFKPRAYRCRSIKRLPSACARFAASRSPSAACTIEPFIRMCQERAKASGSRSPASSARLRTTERMFSR